MRISLPALLLALCVSTPLSAQGGTPFLVQDLNRTPQKASQGSNPVFWTQASGKVLFSATTPSDGRELFVTQGTATSTKIIKDINPGPNPSHPVYLGKLGKLFFFSADDGAHGKEIWATDGTPLGTRLLAETISGPLSSFSKGMGVAQGLLFFLTKKSGTQSLWRTDGTTKGTLPLLKVANGGSSGLSFLTKPQISANGILFLVETASGLGLYKTDGTQPGTKLVTTLPVPAQGTYPIFSSSDGKRLFFPGFDKIHGIEPWTTDGTAKGTSLLTDLVPGSKSSDSRLYAPWNGKMTFLALDASAKKRLLYQSNGTLSGTTIISPKSLSIAALARTSQALLLYGDQPLLQDPPWILSPGQAPIQAKFPQGNRFFLLNALPSVQGILLETTGSAGFQTWVITPKTGAVKLLSPVRLTLLFGGLFTGSKTYLSGLLPSLGGPEPFITDGTKQGSKLIKALYPSNKTQSTKELEAFALGTQMFFLGQGLDQPLGYWSWSGPLQPAVKRKEFSKAPAYFLGRFLFPNPEGAFAFVNSGTELQHLGAAPPWGTLLLKGGPKTKDQASPFATTMGGKLFFGFEDPNTNKTGLELFLSDGTPTGTKLLKDLNPGAGSSFPTQFKTLGNRIYFAAYLKKTGLEPWVSDGTPSGTKLLADLRPGSSQSGVRDFVRWDNRVWFFANPLNGQGVVPYYTDSTGLKIQGHLPPKLFGQIYGLHPLSKLVPTQTSLMAWSLRNAFNVFSVVKKGASYQVQTLVHDPRGITGISALPLQGKTLILATSRSPNNPSSLWISDGTTKGTGKVWTGSEAFWQPLRKLGSRRALFFSKGNLWTTDGTLKGTKPVTTSAPFQEPRGLTLANGLLLFSAKDDAHGREPWAWYPGAHGVARGQGCGGKVLQTPELIVDDPVLGQSFSARGEAAPANAPGLLLLGIPGRTSLRLPSKTQLSCRLFLDLARFWVPLAPFPVSAQGTWTQSYKAPNDPGLAGTAVFLQSLFPRPGNLFEVSNGYEITFGR